MGERRTGPRIELSVACTLTRRHGSPVAGRTVDLGPGGMSVTTERPLTTDELVHFDLLLSADHAIDGEARVLRERKYRVYALRFESLRELDRSELAGAMG
jgi:hypothetical protein